MAITNLFTLMLDWLDGTRTPGPKVQASIASLPLPAGAATSANQTDGSQLARAMGIDGATQRQMRVDALGQPIVVVSNQISGYATSAKQDDIKAAINAPTRGTVSRGMLSWVGAAWDGAAPKKITLGSALAWVRVESLQNPPVTAAGGMTNRYIAICEVGAALSAAMVQSDDTGGGPLAAAQINYQIPTPGRLVKLDANGQADVYVKPNAGTTEGVLTVEVSVA